MNENISLVVDIVKIFAGAFGLGGIALIVWGIASVINKRTRTFKDNNAPIGVSPFNPHLYQRIIPIESEGVSGDGASLIGWVYIIIGIIMLASVIWGFTKLNY